MSEDKNYIEARCMKHLRIKSLISHSLLMFSLITTASIAGTEDTLNAGEMKQLRFLSQALIKSRAIEKEKIDAEIGPERERIKAMRDSLDELSDKSIIDSSVSTLQSAQIRSPDKAIKRKAASTGTTITVPQDHSVKIEKVKTMLEVHRVEIEKELPSRFAFWHKKTKKDGRNEQLVTAISEVEQSLSVMAKTNKIDNKKIKDLKEKLMIKANKVDMKDIDPTLQTITKHRR